MNDQKQLFPGARFEKQDANGIWLARTVSGVSGSTVEYFEDQTKDNEPSVRYREPIGTFLEWGERRRDNSWAIGPEDEQKTEGGTHAQARATLGPIPPWQLAQVLRDMIHTTLHFRSLIPSRAGITPEVVAALLASSELEERALLAGAEAIDGLAGQQAKAAEAAGV